MSPLGMRSLGIRSLLLSVVAPAALAVSPTAAATVGVVELPAPGADAAPTASASAPDSRLRPGCRDYTVRYLVEDADGDWLLNLEIQDRRGQGVAHVNLHGVQEPDRGRASFTVCRSAVHAGRFTVTGVLADRDGYQQTEHPVDGSPFWLTRS